MDKKTGFKECPRCGLRNKPTAKQCDFCGQKFDTADDWEQQIDALEKLSKNSRKVEVSEDMSKKIEATIVTKEMVETKDRAEEVKPVRVVVRPEPAKVEFVPPQPAPPEPVKEEVVEVVSPAPLAPQPEPVVVAPRPEPVPTPTPVVVAPPATQKEVPTPQPIVAEPAPVPIVEETPKAEKAKVTKRERRARPRPAPSANFFRWGVSSEDRMSWVFVGLLILGVNVYFVSIALAGNLGTVISWGFVVVSGLLIVMGFSQVAINWEVEEEPLRVDIPGTADDEVVDICPSCHERVSPDCDRCPACGTEFEPSDDR